jgi:hypothetical protein
MQYQLNCLSNRVPYFVCIQGCNSGGFGYTALASPSPMTPVKHMIALSDLLLWVSWRAPLHKGGLPIAEYVVQWDTTCGWKDSFTKSLLMPKKVMRQAWFIVTPLQKKYPHLMCLTMDEFWHSKGINGVTLWELLYYPPRLLPANLVSCAISKRSPLVTLVYADVVSSKYQ